MGRLKPAPFVLLAEVLVFHWRVLFTNDYVLPWDFRYFHLPFAELQAHCLREGTLALWDPFTYFGRPLWANIQTQTFYPPRLVTLIASNMTGGDHLLYWLELQQIGHILLGGAFTYLLLRKLRAGEAAALAGATVFQLGGFFVSQAQHLGLVNGAAWLPLAWWCVVELADRSSLRWVLLLALSTAMAVLAGLPSLAVAVIGSACLLAAVLIAAGIGRARLLALVVGSAAWGLLLAAVQLLPTIELDFNSIAQYRTEWRGTGGGVPLASLVSLVAPNYYGYFDLASYSREWQPTFLHLYAGLGGLALAVAAACTWRRREAIVFTALTAGVGLVMLGDSTPVGALLYTALPENVRAGFEPEFTMPAFSLGLAVLAGLGASWYLKRDWIGWIALAVIATDLTLVGASRPMNAASLDAEPGVTATAFDGSEELLRKVRMFVDRTQPPQRTDVIDDGLNWVLTAPLTRIPSASGYDPMAPARSIRVRLTFCEGERWGATFPVSRPDSPVLDLVNVGYLLSRTPSGTGDLRPVADLPGRRLYRNDDVMPRFFLSPRVKNAQGMESAVALLSEPSFDPRTEVIVEGPVELENGREGAVRLVSYRENELELLVDTPGPAYLVTSETHYPGWRAWVDGAEQPIYYSNVAFRGLPVPAGRHTVRMEFRPAILWWGVLISLLALGAGIPACIYSARLENMVGSRRLELPTSTVSR